jgi:hypothetical protein
MKRRPALLVASIGVMIVIAGLAAPKDGTLLVLEWAAKAPPETPPAAILIEMGFKDAKPTSWAGKATVTGAKVVHREGYSFRPADKLVEPDGWQASSHRPLRLPPKNAALIALQGVNPVGVVLHLADIKPDAVLSLTVDNETVKVPLKEVLAGHAAKVWNGGAVVRRITATTMLSPASAKTEDDFPAAAYGPDGTLWVAYIGYHMLDESRRIEAAPLKQQPANFRAYDTPTFGDQLFARYRKDGKWSKPIAITGPQEDLMKCAIAVEGDGTAWVVYGANRNSRHGLFGRPISMKNGPQVGVEEPISAPKWDYSFQNPAMSTLSDGTLRLSCVHRDGKWGEIVAFRRREGNWKYAGFIMNPNSHGWNAVVASGPGESSSCA